MGESDWPFKAAQSDSFTGSSGQSDQLSSGCSSFLTDRIDLLEILNFNSSKYTNTKSGKSESEKNIFSKCTKILRNVEEKERKRAFFFESRGGNFLECPNFVDCWLNKGGFGHNPCNCCAPPPACREPLLHSYQQFVQQACLRAHCTRS